MRELPLHKPATLSQRLAQIILVGLRRVMPIRKPLVDLARPPDLQLENVLREHLSFLFSDWSARIVQSQLGTVVIECGNFRLEAIRDWEVLVFLTGPTAHPHFWENADIAIAAVTSEAPLDVRTSLTNLAAALKPRVTALQSAFSGEHIFQTEKIIDMLRDAAIERDRSSRQ